MGLLQFVFSKKADRIEKTEQRLAIIANSMQNLDERKLKVLSAYAARRAFLDIARDYGKNGNDNELAEGVMRLTACYSNCFGEESGFSLLMEIGAVSGGTYLGMCMFDANLGVFLDGLKQKPSRAAPQTATARPVIERTRMSVSEIHPFCTQNRYFLN